MMTVWTADSMTPVLPSTAARHGAPFSITAARGEKEGWQVAVTGLASRVRLQVSDLVGPDGVVIPPSNVDWKLVGLVTYQNQQWPDVLLPVDAFDVKAGETLAALVTISVPLDAKAGVYTGTVTVLADGEQPIAVPISLEVYDFAIPQGVGSSRNTFTLSRSFKSSWAPGEHQAYGDLLLDYRMNPDDIYNNGCPDAAELNHWYDRGLRVFNVVKADNYDANSGVEKFFAMLRGQPNGARLRRDCAYFYGADEKDRPYLNTQMVPRWAALRALYPAIPHLSTAHIYVPAWVSPVADLAAHDIDWICAYIGNNYYTLGDAETVNASGRQYWAYDGNMNVTVPFINARAYGWNMFRMSAQGFLYYATNWWPDPIVPVDPSLGAHVDPACMAPGDTSAQLIYCGTTGPIASMRMAQWRDGLEDYEYLRILADRIGPVEARKYADWVMGASGWFTYSRDPVRFRAARDAVARGILT